MDQGRIRKKADGGTITQDIIRMVRITRMALITRMTRYLIGVGGMERVMSRDRWRGLEGVTVSTLSKKGHRRRYSQV